MRKVTRVMNTLRTQWGAWAHQAARFVVPSVWELWPEAMIIKNRSKGGTRTFLWEHKAECCDIWAYIDKERKVCRIGLIHWLQRNQRRMSAVFSFDLSRPNLLKLHVVQPKNLVDVAKRLHRERGFHNSDRIQQVCRCCCWPQHLHLRWRGLHPRAWLLWFSPSSGFRNQHNEEY